MRVFGYMMLIAAPVLADWTLSHRAGVDLLEQGQPERAIPELQNALAEHPGHPAILDALGRAEFRLGHYRVARKHFDQASQKAGKDKAAALSNSAMASIS